VAFPNLLKKSRPDTQLTSTLSTPRDELSLNKYGSKISLSQLKKSPGEATRYVKSSHEFKKQSKTTTAIQYKNKIKEQINRV
jgi:hypothetical protein